MRAIIPTFIFLLTASLCFGQNDSKPLKIKLLEKPRKLKAGQTYKFTFELRNVSGSSITLSSECATTVGLGWRNKDGSGGGAVSGCIWGARGMSDTGDLYTNKVTGKTEIPPYFESDFFTLPPKGSQKFEVDLQVPENLKVKVVDVYVRYESKYDGSLYGIKAWTGSASLALKMPVVQ